MNLAPRIFRKHKLYVIGFVVVLLFSATYVGRSRLHSDASDGRIARNMTIRSQLQSPATDVGNTSTTAAGSLDESSRPVTAASPAITATPGTAATTPQTTQTAQTPDVAVNTMAVALSSGSATSGNNFSVRIYENSGSATVNAVQANLSYDSAKLEIVSVDQTGLFDLAAASDTKTAGLIRLTRAITGAAATGLQPVVGITFRVKTGASGITTIQPDRATSYLVRSPDSTDILQSFRGTDLTITAR